MERQRCRAVSIISRLKFRQTPSREMAEPLYASLVNRSKKFTMLFDDQWMIIRDV